MPHLRAIEAQDGKASALTDINGTPATIVAGAADQLQNILSAAHKTAMAHAPPPALTQIK
jgi:hypothetical protein